MCDIIFERPLVYLEVVPNPVCNIFLLMLVLELLDGSEKYNTVVMRPLCLVESRSQDAAANVGVLSVYLATILYGHLQLFIDIDRENIPCVLSLCFIVRATCLCCELTRPKSDWHSFQCTSVQRITAIVQD